MTRLSDAELQALIDGTAAMHPAEVTSLATEVLESREAMKGAAVVANHSGALLREKDARIAELEAEVKRLREAGVAMDHVANEWSDAATNGFQMLKNVRDGIETTDQCLAQLKDQFERCRALWTPARAALGREG